MNNNLRRKWGGLCQNGANKFKSNWCRCILKKQHLMKGIENCINLTVLYLGVINDVRILASWIMLNTSFIANGIIPGAFWSPCAHYQRQKSEVRWLEIVILLYDRITHIRLILKNRWKTIDNSQDVSCQAC